MKTIVPEEVMPRTQNRNTIKNNKYLPFTYNYVACELITQGALPTARFLSVQAVLLQPARMRDVAGKRRAGK
jgi:hypothetical protein